MLRGIFESTLGRLAMRRRASIYVKVAVAVVLVATPVAFWLRSGRDEQWRQPLNDIKQLVLPVDHQGAVPRAHKVVQHRCNAELLQKDRWTVETTGELLQMLDRGLADMSRYEPGSDEYAWAEMDATAPLQAIEARFHYGAPIDPEAATAIHERYVLLMRHKSWSMRLAAASGAIHGFMENSPDVRRQLESMTKDDEPIVAALCRRFVQEQNSAEVVRLRQLKQAQRGY